MYAPKQLSPELKRTLMILQNSKDFNTFFSEWQDAAVQALTAANEPMLVYRIQGEINAVNQLQDILRKAQTK